ncbi:MAG: hypothetical protein Q8M24_07545 [Pseudolabrys sp.]|nr:hypothetical protein [Pseudolabrys sp.]MDP2295304.1 hypothetical protein [Pseudolabrys sp.]
MQNAPIPNASIRAAAYHGFIVEVGGQFVCEYGSLTAALKAGLELKQRDAHAQVKVYDAKDRILDRAPA